MTVTLRNAVLTTALLGLTACGGGGDTVIVPTPPTTPPPTATGSDFATLEASFNALESAIPSTASLPAQVDFPGTATYTGFFTGELDPDVNTTPADVVAGNVDFIAGDAQIVVDLANDNNTVGAIGNLQSDTVDDISGTIVLFNFELTRGTGAVAYEGFYSGDLTITDADYPTGAQTVAGQFGGGFFGTDGEFITLVTEPLDDFSDVYFDGDIATERD